MMSQAWFGQPLYLVTQPQVAGLGLLEAAAAGVYLGVCWSGDTATDGC